MCRHHVEAETVLKYCMQRRRTVDTNQDLPIYNTPLDAIKDTMCEPVSDDGFHSETCLKRLCNSCGVEKLAVSEREMSNEIVQWDCFQYIQIQIKGLPLDYHLLVYKELLSKLKM